MQQRRDVGVLDNAKTSHTSSLVVFSSASVLLQKIILILEWLWSQSCKLEWFSRFDPKNLLEVLIEVVATIVTSIPEVRGYLKIFRA